MDRDEMYRGELVAQAVRTIREAFFRFKAPAIMWSGGKDSTALLHLTMEAFLGEVPMPVVYTDTGCQFPEVYEFRDRTTKELGLDLIISKHSTREYTDFASKEECCMTLKVGALMDTITEYKFDALLLGIRGDEHGIRAKERIFSPREKDMKWDILSQPAELWCYHSTGATHTRVHPLLHWSEVDVWRYILDRNIEVPSLYRAKNGRRCRSVGCVPCTSMIESNAISIEEIIDEIISSQTSERAGRSQDKERLYVMQRLRAGGYF